MNITVIFDGTDDPNLPDGSRLAFYDVEAYEVSTPADIMQTNCAGAGCDGCSATHRAFTGTSHLELKASGLRLGGPRWESPLTHACPADGEQKAPCCGRSPFDLPRGERITIDPGLVTCHGRPVT